MIKQFSINWTVLFLVILSKLFNQLLAITKIDALLDVEYQKEITQNETIEYQFILENQTIREYVIRLHLANLNPDLKYPIFVVVKQPHHVMSFQVPVALNPIAAYGNVSRTLCPIQLKLNESQKLNVELSTSMNSKIPYLFKAEPGELRELIVTPAEPVYLRYEYLQNKQSAFVKLLSSNDVCLLLSIQKLECPVNDLSDTVQYKGLHQTVTTLGALAVDGEFFPNGFFVVLVLEPTDYACAGTESIVPISTSKEYPQIVSPEFRAKHLTISVVPTLNKSNYLIPILGAVATYLLFYIISAVLIVIYRKYENWKYPHNDYDCETVSNSLANYICTSKQCNSNSIPIVQNINDNCTTCNNTSSTMSTITTMNCSQGISINPIKSNIIRSRQIQNYGSMRNHRSINSLHTNNNNDNSLGSSSKNQITQTHPVQTVFESFRKNHSQPNNSVPYYMRKYIINKNNNHNYDTIYNKYNKNFCNLNELDVTQFSVGPSSIMNLHRNNQINHKRNSNNDLYFEYQTDPVGYITKSHIHSHDSNHSRIHGWFSSSDEEDNDLKVNKIYPITNYNPVVYNQPNTSYSTIIGQTMQVNSNTTTTNPANNTTFVPPPSTTTTTTTTTTVKNNMIGKNLSESQSVEMTDDMSTNMTDDCTDFDTHLPRSNLYRLNLILYVSDLSKKRYTTLNRKYLLYFWYLIIISIFYGLPAVQLIMTYQKAVFETGNEDLCYYNFECAHSLGIFSAFNNIISNIGYVMLGLLFLGLTARRDVIHRSQKKAHPEDQNLGIPQHYGLFYAMGLALTMEGLMSACYHMCPSFSNFQFDTAYMYILAMLIMLKIYQTRHPDVNASAHSAYMVMAVIIFLGVAGVLYGNHIFWIIFTIFFLLMSVVLTVEIYYMGQWNVDLCLPRRIYYLIRVDGISCFRPMYLERMLLLTIANMVNFSLAGYGIVTRPKDFSTFLLSIFMINLLMYTFFYVIMKLRHRERFQFLPLIYILLTCISWACAIYFYFRRTTTWEVTPARSRTLNQPCILLDYYDAHDIWHFLSSVSMFFSFMLLMYLDDDLANRPRNRIFVF